MANVLRVCLFECPVSGDNDDERSEFFGQSDQQDVPFEQPFREHMGLDIVAKCLTWQQLQEHLCAGQVDVVAVQLDTVTDAPITSVVQRISEVAPDCGIIGVSRNASPEAIIAAMRAGCHQYVRWPIETGDLSAAIDSLQRARLPAMTQRLRICVIGSCGGAGATTVACNLAIELAQATGRRCGLVDMDLQYGSVAGAFDIRPRYTLADVCGTGETIDRTMLESALHDLPCNVSILSGPQQVSLTAELSPDSVDQMLSVMGELFPFVVVDMPRYFTPATMAALSGTQRVLIVTQLAVPYLAHARRLYEGLLQLGVDEEAIELVLNRSNAQFNRIKPDDVEKHFGRQALTIIPNDYKRVGASRDLGHSLQASAPNSPARTAIHNLAKHLASDYIDKDDQRRGGGMFGVFRRRRCKTG